VAATFIRMDQTKRSIVLGALACVLGLGAALAADKAPDGKMPVTTRKSPRVQGAPYVRAQQITVENKLYDPANGQAPKGHENEGALCETKMWSEFSFEWGPPDLRREGQQWVARMQLKVATINVGMGTVLWLPANAPDWIVDHEETHRAISERVYIEGIPKLSALLKGMNGKTYEGRGATSAEAVNAIRKLAQGQIDTTYSELLPKRQGRLNDEFDRRTRHGVNQKKSAGQFMAEIFADEAAATQAQGTTQTGGKGDARK